MAEADVPPNALSHDSWHRLVKLADKVAETYKHPHIRQFSTGESRQPGVGKYLSKASAEAIKERMHYLVNMTCPGSLATDGAKIAKRDMLNTVLVTKDGVDFLKRTDATGMTKDTVMLSQDLVDLIREIGPDKVCLIVMDGASGCIAVMKEIKKIWSHIMIQRCATHGYSLIGKGLSGVSFIKGCAVLGTFIASHSHVREKLKDAGANELLRAASTRFMGFFLVLIAMSVDKDHFFSVLNTKVLLKWAQEQKKPTKRSKTAAPGGEETADAVAEAVRQGVLQGKTVEEKVKYILKTYVNNEDWWEQVAATETFGLPIIHSMRITDTVSPNLHLAHKACLDMQVLVTAAMQ